MRPKPRQEKGNARTRQDQAKNKRKEMAWSALYTGWKKDKHTQHESWSEQKPDSSTETLQSLIQVIVRPDGKYFHFEK